MFDALTMTRSLDVSRNFIQKLAKFCFLGLLELETLLIKDNQITNIEGGSFYGLQNIITLDLSFNKLFTLRNNYHYI